MSGLNILELLEICKKHGVEAEFKYLDFADCYKIKLTKGDQYIAKLLSDDEIKRTGLDPLACLDYILIHAFEELGVDICE